MVLVKNEKLEARNELLERNLSRFSELLKEEKAEKREFVGKYESLQNDLNVKTVQHAEEKTKLMKRYYSLLILCVIALVLLVVFVVPNILEAIWPSQ